MKTFQQYSLFATKIVFLISVSPVTATPLEWTNSDGKSIHAEFVRVEGESVVVNKDGKSFTIPFAKLTHESAEQAKKLSGIKAPSPSVVKLDISPESFLGKTFEECEKILGKPSASLNQFEKDFKPDIPGLTRIKIKEMTLGRKMPDGKSEAAPGMYISYYFKKDTIKNLSGALDTVGISSDGWSISAAGTAISETDKKSLEQIRNMPIGEYLEAEFQKLSDGMSEELIKTFAPALYPSINSPTLGYSLKWESASYPKPNLDPHPDEDVLRVHQTVEDALRRSNTKVESGHIRHSDTTDVGIIAHYRFDGDGKDATKGNEEFTLKNTEFRGNALYLNGINRNAPNGYEVSCIIPTLDYEKFSVALRFQADELIPKKKGNLITCGKSLRWFGLEQSPGGKLEITFNNGSFRREIEGASLERGKWTVVACSVDVGGRIVTVALNGKKVAAIDLPEDFMLEVVKISNQQNWKGSGDRAWSFANYGNGNVLHGLVDELIIYGKALSEDELMRIPLQP